LYNNYLHTYDDYYCYYQVENSKTGGRVASSTLHIRWPYEVDSGYAHGKRLLYLMDPPVVCCHEFYFKFSSSVVFSIFILLVYRMRRAENANVCTDVASLLVGWPCESIGPNELSD